MPAIIDVKITGKEALLKWLNAMNLRAKDRGTFFADAGHYMAFTAIPMNFRQNGPGWPAVLRGGSPLIDTGLLRKTISYTATQRDVVIGSRLLSARVHNEGLRILPRVAKYLAIPLVPPLRPTEARTMRPRDFHSTFIHKSKGIAGGKLVIMQRVWTAGKRASRLKAVRAIFLLVKSVKIKPRPFLVWKPGNLQVIADRWLKHYVGLKTITATPMTGGGPYAHLRDPRKRG